MAFDYIENPRQDPRVRVRCAASISTGRGPPLRASSEDVSRHGCQLISPRTFPRGTTLWIELAAAESPAPLRAVGEVAWSSPLEPWRLGISFTESSRQTATRFFDGLVAARPGMATWRRIPSRVSLGAMVWPAPPPRLVVDFTADEVSVLRAVGSGATVQEVRAKLQDRWDRAQRSFFKLLSNGALTLQRGGSVPFSNWSEILERLEAEEAAEVRPLPPPPAAPVAAPPRAGPPVPHPTRSMPAATPPGPTRPVPAAAATTPARTVPGAAARPPPAPDAPAANDGVAGLAREIELEALEPVELDAPASQPAPQSDLDRQRGGPAPAGAPAQRPPPLPKGAGTGRKA
jgi:hypothetical protein